jgi:hypothetical protein
MAHSTLLFAIGFSCKFLYSTSTQNLLNARCRKSRAKEGRVTHTEYTVMEELATSSYKAKRYMIMKYI